MIFADKLIDLRKKNGWTQEDLAEQMGVSRQSVSKWESAQSIPDLEKILRLAQLFGVSTDYLLREELEVPEYTESAADAHPLPQLSLESANEYLSVKERTAPAFSFGVSLCILCPIPVIGLGILSEYGSLSEDLAGGLGVILLLLCVSAAVAIFLSIGNKTEAYDYLEREAFDSAYGVDGMVRQHQKTLRPLYLRRMILGVVLCILCPVPLMAAAATEQEPTIALSVCGLLCMVALGVFFLLLAGIPWEATQILLQEGDFTPDRKARRRSIRPILVVYWMVALAIYLGWSFYTNAWGRTWIVWPVAGVLCGAVFAIHDMFYKK